MVAGSPQNGTVMEFLTRERGERLNDVSCDLRLIRLCKDAIRDRVKEWDDNRLFVTTSVCQNGDSKMRETLPRILDQADEMGKRCDVILGINCGLTLPHTEMAVSRPGVETKDLFTAASLRDDLGNDVVFDNPCLQGSPHLIETCRHDMHRVFFVRQFQDPSSKGKNKMLKVINDTLLRSIDKGVLEQAPSRMLEIDDDARLYDGLNIDTNGLKILHAEMDKGHVDAIGARWRTVRYREQMTDGGPVSHPDFSLPFDDSYRYLDTSQAEWFRFMPGGATLGNTDLLLSARWPIGHRYPASLSDDVHRTMYVSQLGAPWKIADYSYVLNESRNSEDQLLRWLRGTFGLRRKLGRECFTRLYKTPLLPPEMNTVPPLLDRLMSEALLSCDTSLQTAPSDW